MPFKGPYGIPTNASEPVHNLIEVKYTTFTDEGIDYPQLGALARKGRLPAPAPTKASKGHDIRERAAPKEKTPFVMKKFQNIQSRLGSA